MKIKRYEADTMSRAMAQIKRDMGSEAVILQIKKKKRFGRFLFPRQQYVQVVAGTDMNVPEQYRPEERELLAAQAAQAAAGERYTHPLAAQAEAVLARSGGASAAVAAAPAPAPAPDTGQDMENPAALDYQLRIKEMKSELDRLKSNISRMLAERRIQIRPKFHGMAGQLYDSLLKRGVSEELGQRVIYLLKEAKSELESEGLGSKRLMLDHFARKLGSLFPIGGHIDTKRNERRVITVIGPTGEGKTTTIAKLAANYSLVVGKKVGLISADTYRIAAPEQLKTYAEIIGIPVEVVYTPIELSRALDKFGDRDMVFIDTAGRSPSNSLHMSELKAYLHAAGSDEVHLVLSATKKLADMRFAIDRFRGIDFRSVLFTKLDETMQLDSVMNLSYQAKWPISYFGTGQDVPDDIELANTDRFVEFILRGIQSDRSGAAVT